MYVHVCVCVCVCAFRLRRFDRCVFLKVSFAASCTVYNCTCTCNIGFLWTTCTFEGGACIIWCISVSVLV